MPGAAGHAPRAQQESRRVRRAYRPGPPQRHRAAVPVPPEELLLSGHAQELSDQPVRRAHLQGRVARGRRAPHRHRAGAHGGGHGEVDPCGAERAHPRVGRLPRRLQPRRRAADGDSVGARPAIAGRSASVRVGAARHPRRPRRVRREDGGGVSPRRRQRLAAPRRRWRVRDQGRDQEHELSAVGAEGVGIRDRAPDRRPRRGRDRGAGDAPFRREHGHHLHHAHQGGGGGLPVLPRARPRSPPAAA